MFSTTRSVRHATFTIALLVCSQSFATTLSDPNFSTGWTSTKVFDDSGNGSATFVATVLGTGGNPGAYRELELDYPNANTQIGVVNTWATATYDPSVKGDLQSVKFDWDHFSTGRTTNAYLVIRPVLEQGGTYFQNIPSGGAVPNSWTSYSSGTLTESDFCDISQPCLSGPAPDFSTSGAPITFGYVVYGSSYLKSGSFLQTANVDNFQLNLVPEPCHGIASVLGLLALLRRRCG